MGKTLLAFNRYAHKGKLRHSLEDIQIELKRANIFADSILTDHAGHASELAEEAVREGYQRIIVVGGDGTINEAVNGLILAQRKGYGNASLGVIPNGRGNDFCYSMKIPTDLTGAISALQANRQIPIDVGLVKYAGQERFYANGAGIGFDAAINYHATRSRFNGLGSYMIGLIKGILFDFKQPVAQITFDEGTMELPILFLAAMNGAREGSSFVLAPNFDITDGKLDVFLIGRRQPIHKLLPVIPYVFKGDLSHPEIVHFQTSHVKVDLDGNGVFGQTDGELIFHDGTSFEAKIIPEKINFIMGL